MANTLTAALATIAEGIHGARRDGWENAQTGLGTARDKATYGTFAAGFVLSHGEVASLYQHDDLAATMINARPEEMLRAGYDLKIGDDGSELVEDLQADAELLDVDARMLEGMIWGALFGGALVIVGADDGQHPTMPLNEERVRAVHFLSVIDRRWLSVARRYSNPLAPKFGEPEIYMITHPESTHLSWVHESRCVRFEGPLTDATTKRALDSWTVSSLQRPYNALRSFAAAYAGVDHLMTDASQGVFKLENLMDQIANNKEALQTRMQLLDMSRSVCRAVLVDASSGEDFTRVATSFAGIPDVLDRYMYRLAAAAGMPVTRLFGRSPAGMNATGESDDRNWYDSVKSDQRKILAPRLRRLYRLLTRARGADPEGIEVAFRPLWEPTATERATLEKTVAERDAIYIQALVWRPEEVAIARSRGHLTAEQTEIDVDEREASLKSEFTFNAQEGAKEMASIAAANEPSPDEDPDAEEGDDEADASE